ncbi:MAG: preprotein translocase subunit SecE [Alphaproteobacteria bacterium]
MKKNKIITFIEQVKQESVKISWPSKKEVISSSLMIFVIVLITALFFLVLDTFIHYGIQIILNV